MAVLGSGILSARVISYHDVNNWYLLGLFMPVSYVILGLLESGRVCSLRAVTNKEEPAKWWSQLFFFIGLYALVLLILSLVFGALPMQHGRFFMLYTLAYITVSTN